MKLPNVKNETLSLHYQAMQMARIFHFKHSPHHERSCILYGFLSQNPEKDAYEKREIRCELHIFFIPLQLSSNEKFETIS